MRSISVKRFAAYFQNTFPMNTSGRLFLNVPSKMFCSTYGSEIFRTEKTTSSEHIFLNNSKKLITRMCKQGDRINPIQPGVLRGGHSAWGDGEVGLNLPLPIFFEN